MSVSGFRVYSLCGFVAAAMLSGCGGSQPPAGASGPVPQTPTIARYANRDASWMVPEARARDLLYVSSATYQYSDVYVYTFPALKLVGGIVVDSYADGLCSNGRGDVFVTAGYEVYEYRHAQAKRAATISDPLGASGCSVNPKNGDLAVAGSGGLAIFGAERRHQWRLGHLFSLDLDGPSSCAYDGSGNLFFDGTLSPSSGSQQLFEELPMDGKQLENVTLDASLLTPGNLAWDGKDLAVGDNGNLLIHRFAFQGTQGTQVGTLSLHGVAEVRQFWIQKGILIGPAFENAWLFGLWHYPGGGKAHGITDQDQAAGVTISIAPPK